MDFAFTPQQQALKDGTRRLAEERIAPIAEEADESADGSSQGLMAMLAESELLRYTVPENYGGFGVRVMNLCIIREELARVSAQADTNFIMQGLGSYPITLGGYPRAEGPLPASAWPGASPSPLSLSPSRMLAPT